MKKKKEPLQSLEECLERKVEAEGKEKVIGALELARSFPISRPKPEQISVEIWTRTSVRH